MSARSIQCAKLGYEVARELGLRGLEIRWSGSRKSGSFGGWRVEWGNGPTVPVMRRLVLQRARRYPAVPAADLGYDRGHTALAEAVALLLYVDRDQSWADCIETPLIFAAFDSVDWPERADDVWLDRARALLWHTPTPEPVAVTAYAVRALARYARTGWDNALAWLDRLSAEHAAIDGSPQVINLASPRTPDRDGRGRWHA